MILSHGFCFCPRLRCICMNVIVTVLVKSAICRYDQITKILLYANMRYSETDEQ